MLKYDHTVRSENGTESAIKTLSENIKLKESLYSKPTIFFAHPYDDKNISIANIIKKEFEGREFEVAAVKPGINHILKDICMKIRKSHGFVADITDYNPNVIMELGMAIEATKKYCVLRKEGENEAKHFSNISHIFIHEYEMEGDTLKVVRPDTQELIPLPEALSGFIKELEKELELEFAFSS